MSFMRMPKGNSHVWVTINGKEVEAVAIGSPEPRFISLTGKEFVPDSWRYRDYNSKKKK